MYDCVIQSKHALLQYLIAYTTIHFSACFSITLTLTELLSSWSVQGFPGLRGEKGDQGVKGDKVWCFLRVLLLSLCIVENVLHNINPDL